MQNHVIFDKDHHHIVDDRVLKSVIMAIIDHSR